MLSIGNQPSDPPPPPCASSATPPLLHCSNSTHDRRSPSPSASAPKRKLASSAELDLTSKPNFSIRNYVFTARRKDISSNWPFSQKNLQLCLKHGVKDPLPPFESSLGCTVKALKEPPKFTNPHHSLNNEITEKETCVDDFPSTITKRQSIPVIIEIKEAAAAVPESSSRLDSGPRLSGKKCKLIPKLGGCSDRSTEDIASNSTAVFEAMGSKVCPVCKTFSSSSNTALNAHIDQCLSEDSTPKWTEPTKLGRNRVKPRKTKLMVDIYVTAPRCTVEELDRRNGRNWAAASVSCPNQDSEVEPSDQEKKHKISAPNHEDEGRGGGIGDVYIDSNGTKLRILSKSVDDAQPLSRGVEGLGKSLKGAKNSRYLSLKKKKKKRRKADKYLKLASRSERFQSPKTRASKDFGGGEMHHGARGGGKDLRPCNSRSQGLMVNRESPTLKRWACSKRSGLFRDGRGQSSDAGKGGKLCSENALETEKTFSSFERQEDTLRVRDSMSPGKRKIGVGTGCDDINGSTPPKKISWNSSSSSFKASRFFRLNKESVSASSLMRPRDDDRAKKDTSPQHWKTRMMAEINEEDPDSDSGDRPSREGTSEEYYDPDEGNGMNAESSSVDTSDFSGKHPDDLESSGTEFRDDCYTAGTSTNFTSYLNPENLKLYDSFENRPHFEQSKEKHKGSLGGCVEKIPSPIFTSFADGEDSGDDMDVNKDLDDDDDDVGGEYEVERIPIPGPPGSFLPSPRALGSEDFHGTSSLTTSRVQSSQEPHDFVDGDSSDSPVSATSTVSNSDPLLKSFVPLSSELELSGPKVALPISFVSNSEEDGNFRAGNGKGAWIPSRDDQLCCCQRKERNNLGVVLNYQESQILRRRNTALTEKRLEVRGEILDHNKSLDLGSDVSRPSTTPSSTVKGCDSGAAAPTNPVFRLMGKNLVLNKEGDTLAPPGFSASRVLGVPSSSGGYSGLDQSHSKTEILTAPPDVPLYWRSPNNFSKGQNRPARNMVVPDSREIIVIDDSPDTESDHRAADLARYRRPVVAAPPSGFSFPTVIRYDSRGVTHFPVNYRVLDPSFFGQLPGGGLSRRVNGSVPMNNAMWCTAPGGSSNLHQMPPPPSTSAPMRMRSPLPYSPGLS